MRGIGSCTATTRRGSCTAAPRAARFPSSLSRPHSTRSAGRASSQSAVTASIAVPHPSRKNADGFTQEELANALGVTRRSVQGYEAGHVAPFRHLDRLSELLGRSTGWFLLEEPAASNEALQEALRQHRLTLERDLRRIVREEVASIL